jgi:hypothetical protein
VNVKENLKDSTNLSKKDYMCMKRKSNFDLQEEELSDRLITYQKILYKAKIVKLMGLGNVGIRVMQQRGKDKMNNR